MTTPAAASSSGQWWVVSRASGARGGPPQLIAVQSSSPPPGEIGGPFPTQAAAQQFILQQENQSTFPAVPNPFGFLAALGWIQEIGHWLGILISAATDLHTYISLGWLTLGFWMLVIGLLLWLRIPQRAARAARDAGAAAAVAAA